ncbi:MAG: LysE family transporter [Ignavibacteriales bacterium]|nr:LysE family transporter [Ignavibacteriales bacterium]
MIALIVGFVIGFGTSVPIGPINIAVMTKGLSNKTGQGLMIGAGSGFMDILYCGAAMFGISTLMANARLELAFRIATFVVFLMFGIRTLFFKVHDPAAPLPEKSGGLKRYFLFGILLYLSNPSFIAYWITVAGVVQGYKIIEASVYNNLLFAIGTGFGTTGWFFTLLKLVEKQKMKLDRMIIQRITRGFGAVLLIISCVMGYELLSSLLL